MSRTNRDIKIKKVKKLRKNHLCKNHINYDNIFIDTSLCKKTEITSDFTGKTSSYSKTDSDPEIKLKQAAELWKRYSKIHLKGSTYLKYSNLIDKHIIPELGDICISQINSVLLADFMNHKLKHGRIDKNGGLAASYVKNIMIIITEIINFSIDEGYSSPIRIKLHMPKNEKGEIRVMDKINQKTLEDYLFSHLTPTNMGILLSLNTGLRIGEICALKWSDIDFQKAILKVNSTVSRVKSDDENSSKSKLIIDTPKTQSSIREIPIISQLMKPLIFLFETRNANASGAGQITIRDLIKSSLRMRPERIIVGEVRGGEALDMLQAMNTGHDGSLSTGHANSTEDMLSRLETMVLQGAAGLPLEAIRQQIASAVDIIIHLSRLRDKSRKTMEITEVVGYENGKIILNPLYVFEEDENSTLERVSGTLHRTKNPMKNTFKLQLAGVRSEF